MQLKRYQIRKINAPTQACSQTQHSKHREMENSIETVQL